MNCVKMVTMAMQQSKTVNLVSVMLEDRLKQAAIPVVIVIALMELEE